MQSNLQMNKNLNSSRTKAKKGEFLVGLTYSWVDDDEKKFIAIFDRKTLVVFNVANNLWFIKKIWMWKCR